MIAGLFFLLLLAVIFDLRTYRIPNALTMAGMAVGLIYQLYRAGPPGMFGAVKDLVISILFLFPLYCFKCLGAGDIKLLSVVAIFLGWKQGLVISIYSLFAGALIGVIKAGIMLALRRVKFTNINRLWKSKEEGASKEPADNISGSSSGKQAVNIIANLGKEVQLYSVGNPAETIFSTEKKWGKEVAGRLQKKFPYFLGINKTDKYRQKERIHMGQMRSADQLLKSSKKNKSKKRLEFNQRGRIGETNQNNYFLHRNDRSNLLIFNSRKNHKKYKVQLGIISRINIFNDIKRKKQLQRKKGAEEQRCVIHYSVAILIAFLVARLS